MIFELRIYRIKSGCMDEWVRLMDNTIIPFQTEKGMQVIGSFVSVDQENEYVWMRRFRDEEERSKLYDAVYGSDTWKNEIRPAIGDMLLREKTEARLLEATARSLLQ
jgi:hypothetical protein